MTSRDTEPSTSKTLGDQSSGRWKLMIRDGVSQFEKLWQPLLLLYLPIVLFYVLLNLISRSSEHMSISDLTYDVTVLGGLPFYAGMLSQLGLMAWAATASICLFTVILLGKKPKGDTTKRFLTQAALFTLFLLLDDAFLFHEEIAPDYLGVSQNFIFLLYMLLYLAFFLSNWSEILTSEYVFLGLAMALFALSILFDVADLDRYESYGILLSERFQTFLEDGFKFAGIATWFVYFTRYAIQKVRRYGFSNNGHRSNI